MPNKLPSALASILAFAYRNHYSDFYRNKFDVADINLRSIKTLEDFQKIPFTTKEELAAKNPDEILFLPLDFRQMGVAYSSGSSGKGLSVLYRFYANAERRKVLEHIFAGCERIMMVSNIRQLIGTSFSLLKIGKMPVPVDINNLEAAAILSSKVKIDAIHGPCVMILNLAPFLRRYYDPSKIRVLSLTGGRSLTSLEKKFLKKQYPFALAISFYGMSENGLGHLGFQCTYLAQSDTNIRVYHPSPHCFFEIVSGEIVMTHLRKAPFTCIRFRTGDRGELVNLNCPCGQKVGLRVLGRIHNDLVKVGGAIIKKSQIERIFNSDLRDMVSGGVLHIYEKLEDNRIIPSLVLEVVPKNDVKLSIFDQEKILQIFSEQLFISQTRTLGDLIRDGIFFKPELKIKNPADAGSNAGEILVDHRWDEINISSTE